VDEGTVKPVVDFPWLGSVPRVSIGALTALIADRKGICPQCPVEKPASVIHKGSPFEHLDEKNQTTTR